MSVIQVTSSTFDNEVIKHQGIVFVDFYAEWCGPCKAVSPIIDALAETKKEIKFVKVNVDENQDLAAKYSVFSIPTFLIFKNGDVKNQFVGAQSKESLESEISKA